MPIIKPQGLRGLQGLGGLSKAQYNDFITKNRDLIAQHGNDPTYINQLYSNKQFIDKYGIDKFKAIPDANMRDELFKEDIVNTEFDRLYKPTRNNKGLGVDYNKYSEMSTDGKLKLLESNFLLPDELNKKVDNEIKENNRRIPTLKGGTNASMSLGDFFRAFGAAAIRNPNEVAMENSLHTDEINRQVSKELNQKILDRIYNDDVDAYAAKFGEEVGKAYADPYISAMSDSQVKEAFVQAITPGSYTDKRGVLNKGIAEYASHYGKGTNSDITSEMSDFSIDDMRKILAKKQVYDTYMSPDMAATALNNEAKRYIKDHQGNFKKFGLFLKDIGISSMSYTADKMNGIAELYRMGQDALLEKPIVMVDDRGNIIDPNKTHVVRDRQGNLHYQDNQGNIHSVHQEQIDYTTLHNMGKNTDGSDIEGALGTDWMTLNPQYWNRAEQYGTLDENEQKQYEKLGSSPYKVAYDPNEDTSILYEAGKMASFGVADTGAQLLPYGVGTLGKYLKSLNSIGKVARGFGKILDTTGKMLTAESKTGQVLQGTSGALGIAYAYNRGAFQETLQQNLANAEEDVNTASKQDIFNRYNKDKNYKAQVDKLIDAKTASLKANYIAQMQMEGGMKIADEKALDKMLHARAQDAVLGELVQNRINERMSSREYADLQQEAINSAGDAAFNTFWPEAVKYGFVNTLGYRKFLYTNPASLTKKVSSSLKGLKEFTTAAGKKRMTTETSKFLTRGDKLRQLGKTAASQTWGGMWTNGTDDMQVDAAERINEDSYNRYLNAYQNGEALANVYSFADGMYSYMKGLANSVGQETTWNAALVGGLGSVVNFSPNFVNIARLATKEGREAYKNNFRREVERDKNGIPLKNEDGTVKYKDYGITHNWRGQLNYFLQNGVLNTYYGKKQSERDLQNHADYVNNLLDSYNDFVDIEKLVASNLASENLGNVGDQKTMNFVRALHALNTLDKLGNDSSDPTTMSSVVQNVKSLIEKASQLNDESGESPFSEEEIGSLLSQYYAANPSLEQSDYNNQKALYDIAQNAQTLQEASKVYDEAEKEIQKIEKNRRETIDPLVRERLKEAKALDKHWTDRKEKMQSEIGDPLADEGVVPYLPNSVLTVGGMRNAQALIKVYDRQKDEITKELEEQKKKTSELNSKVVDAEDALKSNALDSNARYQAEQKLKEVRANMENSKEQEKYLEDLLTLTSDKRKVLSNDIDIRQQAQKESPDTLEEVLTADEIFSLDPVTRARMLNKDNRSLYSKEQQREIEKLEERLLMKDADSLQKIQDIALLTQRINANKDAYKRMADNSDAAAMAVENQRIEASKVAYDLINQMNAETFVDAVNQLDENVKNNQDISENTKNKLIFDQMRELNSNILNIIDSDDLLPQYKQQISNAKEWVKTAEDIEAIIEGSNQDSEWKNNTLRNIHSLIDNFNTREEIMSSLERAIDNLKDSEVINDLDFVLNGLKDLGYQRDATILGNRQKRKEREEAENKKKEEQKKAEEEVKKEAEKDVKEDSKEGTAKRDREDVNYNKAIINEDSLEEVDFGDLGETSNDESESSKEETKSSTPKEETKTEILSKEKNGTITIQYDKPVTYNSDEYEVLPETAKHEENAEFEVHSSIKDGDNTYFIGNFAGSNEQTKVKAKTDVLNNNTFGQENNATVTQGEGVINNVEIIDDAAYGKSPSLESQAAEVEAEGKEVFVSDNTEDVSNSNVIGEQKINTEATTLSGNGMSRYESKPLSSNGIIKLKVGKKGENDKMNLYYAWLRDAGINLQNIIDHELARIIKKNPHAKVKFMAVTPQHNATEDVRMQTHLMLVLDYDDKINKGITSIHNDSNGGVIESLGKKYLIIGTAGYGDMNQDKLVLYDRLWNSNVDGFRLKTRRREFFDKHPNERFYVNEELTTEVVPYSQIPGYIVRQTEKDANPMYRSVKELLEDKERNPHGYTMNTASWGIQEASKFLVVGTPLDNVMIPRNDVGNRGSAFVLMPASNGKMVPSYLKVLKYTEMRDGSLKKKIDDLLQIILSPNYNNAINAIMELHNILYLDKEGDDILRRKTRDEVSLIHNGNVYATFALDDVSSRAKFLEAFKDVNPRVNITAKVLSSKELLNEYDEAGALMTDAAIFGTAGSSFSVYGIDANGDMIQPQSPVNEFAKNANKSDFQNDKRQVIYNKQYYVEDNGTYTLDGKIITDDKLIKQLEYNSLIRDGELVPATSKKVFDYYILNGSDNPQVIKVNRNTKNVTELSKEQSKEIVDEINEQKAKEQREKAAQKAIKAEDRQNVEESVKAAENVDMGEGFEVDPNTGEIIQSSSESESKEVKSNEDSSNETASTEMKTSNRDIDISLESPDIAENKMPTQTFTDLMKNKTYKVKIRKLLNKKWKDMPKKTSEMKKFLKDKDIEVDAIGTSEADIEAWIKTMEDCR